MGLNNQFIKNIISWKIFPIILLIIPLLTHGIYFVTVLNQEYISSWDGVQHGAFVNAYQQEIFPALYGRINTWGMGMTWPLGYNPLSIYTSAIIGNMFEVQASSVLLLISILSVILIAPLSYFLALKTYKSKLSASISSLLVLIFMYGKFSGDALTGVTFIDTLEIGLFSQAIATAIFLVTLIVLRIDRIWSYLLSILLTAIVILTNTHVAIGLFIFLAVHYLFVFFSNPRPLNIIKPSIHLILTLLFTLFWIYPYFQVRGSFLYKSLESVSILEVTTIFLPVILIGILAKKVSNTKLSIWDKNLLFTTILLIILSIIPIADLLNGLPIQPIRYTPLALLLSLIIAGHLVAKVITTNKILNEKDKLSLLFILSIVFIYWGYLIPGSAYTERIDNGENELVSYLRNEDERRSIIENYTRYYPDLEYSKVNGYPTSTVINSKMALSDSEVLWSVFRESTATTPFILPVVSSFSESNDFFGSVCYLCDVENRTLLNNGLDNGDFYFQDLNLHLERASALGVNTIAVRSNASKNLFKSQPHGNWINTQSFGFWDVYESTSANPKITPVKTLPIATFSDYNTSNRQVDEYDWFRINEEMMFHSQIDDHILTLINKPIDHAEKDLQNFEIALITNYNFDQIEDAYNILSNFAKDNLLILLSNEDSDLFRMLTNEPVDNNIFIWEKTGNVRNDIPIVSDKLHQTYIDKGIYDISFNYMNEIEIVNIDNNEFKFSFNPEGFEEINKIPVIIKYNYFPWFETDTDLYMASPTFMLTFVEQPGEHTIKLSLPEYIGNTLKISLAGILSTALIIILILSHKLIVRIGLITTNLLKNIATWGINICRKIVKYLMMIISYIFQGYK